MFNNSTNADTRILARTTGFIAAGVITALVVTGYVVFLIMMKRRVVLPKSVRPPSLAEIPDTQLPLYYMSEMPHHSPLVWELSASPRGSVAQL